MLIFISYEIWNEFFDTGGKSKQFTCQSKEGVSETETTKKVIRDELPEKDVGSKSSLQLFTTFK